MKTAALVFIILDVLVLFGFGAFYLLGFAMSFDAPDSGSDPKAWWLRFVFFLPVLLMLVALIYAVVAFSAGNYKRSFIFSIVPVAAGVLIYLALMISSLTTMMKFKNQTAKEAAEAKLYPIQKFLRQVEGGTDTIIVFPNRLVAYRKYQGTDIPWGGPLGDLNEARNTLYIIVNHDTKIHMDELDQFVDEKGRKFTDVYAVEVTKHPPKGAPLY